MKISPVKIIKYTLGTSLLAGALFVATPKTQEQIKDSFEKRQEIPPSGTSDFLTLLWAPNPQITVQGIKREAAIVVDLEKNVLYTYNEKGRATSAYLIASGAKTTPTNKGLRVVTHVEKYPYKSAPPQTKRYKHPKDYGPRVICLETLDPTTGKRGRTGEFIHGNNNPQKLGQYVSKGCMRMDNEVIKKLAKEVKKGDLVLII